MHSLCAEVQYMDRRCGCVTVSNLGAGSTACLLYQSHRNEARIKGATASRPFECKQYLWAMNQNGTPEDHETIKHCATSSGDSFVSAVCLRGDEKSRVQIRLCHNSVVVSRIMYPAKALRYAVCLHSRLCRRTKRSGCPERR